MKKLSYLLLILVAFAACDKDKGTSQKLDPNATINLRPAAGVPLKALKADAVHLTAKEIVKQATNIRWRNTDISTGVIARGFAPTQRDTVNILLKMWGTDIIDQDGKYEIGFINGKDFILDRAVGSKNLDTIGYIPNAVMNTARTKIKAAYDSGNYTECYRLFNELFTFTPITGAEYRELVKQGKN